MSPEDRGLFGPDAAAEGAPLKRVSASAVLRSKWLILGVFALVAGVAIPCIWMFVKPTYRASALVRVSPVVARMVFPTEENRVSTMSRFYASFVNTQISVIKSPTVLQRVLDQREVQATEWYRNPPSTLRTLLGGTRPSHLERLKGILSVQRQPNTELIDVSVTTLVPEEAAVIADAVVDMYAAVTKGTADETALDRRRKIADERMAVSRQLGQLHKSRSSSSEGFGAESADQLHLLEATRLRGMEADSAELLREYTLMQEGLDSLIPAEGANEDDGDGSGVGTGPSLRFVNDQAWRQFNVALQNARNELEQALQEYGERHHRVKKCRVNVEHQERLLRNREVELSEERVAALRHVDPGLDGAEVPLDRVALERQTRRQKRRLELLDEDLEDQRAKVAQAAAIAEGAARLREGIDRVAKDFDVIRERERVLEMEDKAPARIGVADHAVVPTVPHRDRRFLLTVLALGGGLMTGLVIAHLRASLSPRICEPGDVQLTVRVPFLGQLPALPGGKSPEADWNPAVVESVRMVRTALLQRLSGTDDRAVLITSASMQAGKTSVAIELAKSLAHLGKKTLLVEADLRRPSLSERLGLESTVGLAALLNGTATDHQAIVPGCVPQMDVLPAGERPEEFDSELLANGEFAAGLARWKTCYDFVLIDSPPVLPVADARILAGQADGTIMVLRSSHCRQTDVIQAYADLSAAGGTLLGTVLVGARLGGRYGYRGDYGAYHDGTRALQAGMGTE